jgi:Tol biopolymer transport system component
VDSRPGPSVGQELQGQLIYLRYNETGQQLMKFDLETGEQKILFQAPSDAWVTGASVSPNGDQILLAYAPPPADGQIQSGYSDLSLVPFEGAETPQPVLARSQELESYWNPLWAPDGNAIFFNYFIPDESLEAGARYEVGRVPLSGGESELLVGDAIWPRLSSDGRWLVYVTFNPLVDINKLFVLDVQAGGSQPVEVVLPDGFPIIDAPLFSPDGTMIYFSAQSSDVPLSLSWLGRLMGVEVARAHSVPSDWWRVPISGGEPERLTEIFETGLYADFSPNGGHLAFISDTGLHVMKPDGSELVTLLEENNLFGTLEWID